MQIKKEKDHYEVKSESSNKWYEVYPDRPFCTCPNFVFRSVRGGGVCKHIAAVQVENLDSDKELIEYVKAKGEVESLELIKQYGEPKINNLIQRGELVEKAGMIRVLE
ncbi:MAG: SWIM zinc finger family protein [Candidatus Woesearchaeota archaeon]